MTIETPDEQSYSLQELAQVVGLNPRTVRSWIQQDLLPGPAARGRGARYGELHLRRLHLICRLRDDAGLSLGAIRRLLLGRSLDEIVNLPDDGVAAARGLGHGGSMKSSATRYLDDLFARSGGPKPPRDPASSAPPARPSSSDLESAFFHTTAPRKSHAESWWRIPVTSDVELNVRAGSDPESVARFERVADQLRELLLKGTSQ